MKRPVNAFIISLVMMFIASQGQGQTVDRFNFMGDLSFGYLPLKLAGVYDRAENGTTSGTDIRLINKPKYSYVDTSGILGNFKVHLGTRIYLYQNQVWETGVELSGGVGYQAGLKSIEGLNSFLFDFPQYLYWRHYGGALDFSLLAGYQYTYTALPYHLLKFGIYLNSDEGTSVGITGSPFAYKYYNQFTDGRLEPAVIIIEFELIFKGNLIYGKSL